MDDPQGLFIQGWHYAQIQKIWIWPKTLPPVAVFPQRLLADRTGHPVFLGTLVARHSHPDWLEHHFRRAFQGNGFAMAAESSVPTH